MKRMADAVILFGHGARDPAWAEPMRRIRARMLEAPDAPRVELAFLELMAPDLGAAIDAQVAAGVGTITVVPVFLAQGGHLKRDLPRLLDEIRSRHPACRIRLAPAAGEAAEVVAAMAAYAGACAAAAAFDTD